MWDTDAQARLIEPYGPRYPLAEIVQELNRIYHAIEAKQYSETHPEIYDSLPHQWHTMLTHAQGLIPTEKWHVLDFGCGAGFEATQLLKNEPQRIASLTCYDLSPEMLEECRRRIDPLFPGTRYLSNHEELKHADEPYNLLITNSLLHHLPTPLATINQLLPMLTKDAVWIAGHEPSNRFFRNDECLDVMHRYERQQRWRRILTGQSLLYRIKNILNMTQPGVSGKAAEEALRRGLFDRMPPAMVISRLVDIGVAHSIQEAVAGRGLDYIQIQKELAETWSLEWVMTYDYLGPYSKNKLSAKQTRICQQLADKYSQDGSHFSTIWKRRSKDDANHR